MEIGDGDKFFNLNMEETVNNFEANILGVYWGEKFI